MGEGKRRIPIDRDRAGSGPVAAEPSVAAEDSVAAQEFEETPVDPLAGITAERDSYLDSLQRLKAEFDNFRRRADREVLETRTRARMGLLAEFLPVLDNLQRALNAAEHHEEGKVLEGVRLTHVLFADLLRKEGVTEVDALGTLFDPHLHEAVMSQSSDQEEGLVTAVFEPGYLLGDRVLRPAKVVVSAGPTEA